MNKTIDISDETISPGEDSLEITLSYTDVNGDSVTGHWVTQSDLGYALELLGDFFQSHSELPKENIEKPIAITILKSRTQ